MYLRYTNNSSFLQLTKKLKVYSIQVHVPTDVDLQIHMFSSLILSSVWIFILLSSAINFLVEIHSFVSLLYFNFSHFRLLIIIYSWLIYNSRCARTNSFQRKIRFLFYIQYCVQEVRRHFGVKSPIISILERAVFRGQNLFLYNKFGISRGPLGGSGARHGAIKSNDLPLLSIIICMVISLLIKESPHFWTQHYIELVWVWGKKLYRVVSIHSIFLFNFHFSIS